ncbi:hypothetical protein QYE76_012998 [Lolium multiflorum]|uniref:Uncharacterized protein n=1 Tax=Lolium multiflorum TaxID=4521 RepID=A0AAD8X4F5_LOLMU|nr:hypothetical protein QYE76_012998 [Lolium multiflorum]
MIKATVAAKNRKEDLKMLMVDTRNMDNVVKAWCVEQRAMILAERRAPPATQLTTTTPPTTSTPPATATSSATLEEVPSTPVDDITL